MFGSDRRNKQAAASQEDDADGAASGRYDEDDAAVWKKNCTNHKVKNIKIK